MAAADEKFLKEAFEAFDTDKSGSIDLKELKAVMKSYFELVKEPADDKKINDVSEVRAYKCHVYIYVIQKGAIGSC